MVEHDKFAADLEKRVARLEDGQAEIKAMLARLEQRLDRRPFYQRFTGRGVSGGGFQRFGRRA